MHEITLPHERTSDIIIRRVKVNRRPTFEAALGCSGWRYNADRFALDSIQAGVSEEIDVHFFPVRGRIGDIELETEYEVRGFRAADPYAVLQVNVDDPTFADTHPNGTHWQASNGKWCGASFGRSKDDLGKDKLEATIVRLTRFSGVVTWISPRWFAGFPKK